RSAFYPYMEPLAALLALLLAVLLAFIVIRGRRRRRVRFYDAYGEVCMSAIRRNRVDLTKAVEKASGKSLKVHIDDRYANGKHGNELKFFYNGSPVGSITISGNDDFVIDLC
ncbi:MAG: hypothetical protein VB064_14990, partial [Oscillospiraceae bacterium]|nr:hypothetical protein [Oscillospiraceae bacterium]